jgi:hypothetical protein
LVDDTTRDKRIKKLRSWLSRACAVGHCMPALNLKK